MVNEQMREAATEKYIYPVHIYIQQEVYKKDNKNNTWQGEMRDVSTCCLIVRSQPCSTSYYH